MKSKDIDALDRALLGVLARHGRLTQLQLAEYVPLSPTAIARRMRAMEEAGIIAGYAATVDLEALGYQMTAIVRVSLVNQSESQLSAFERAVADIPAVTSCCLMSGEDDYVMTVIARDLADYERIHKLQLSTLPGIARLTSSFVLRSVLSNRMPNGLGRT